MNLFKYSKIDQDGYTINNLKNNQIYCQSPSYCNDPYEFNLILEVNDEIYDDYLKITYGDGYKQIIENNISKEDVLHNTRQYFIEDYHKSFGFSCFTERENNDVMWAHYADRHQGICIEYDITQYPFNFAKPVKYCLDVPVVRIESLENIEKVTEDSLLSFYSKPVWWSYEKEWRCLSNAQTTIDYPPNAIISITFGFKCREENKNKIYETTKHLKIKYFDIVRARDAYLTKKEPVDFK